MDFFINILIYSPHDKIPNENARYRNKSKNSLVN